MSGFQSVQFRLIENKFGLLEKDRVRIEGHSYSDTVPRADDVALVVETENSPSPFDHLERWLARTPFVRTEDFDFVATYRQVAKAKHDATRASLQGKPDQLATFEQGILKGDAVWEKMLWDQEMQQGSRRLSYEAFMAALFINLYWDEPILHIPYLILTVPVDIDQQRSPCGASAMVLMVRYRMLGRLTRIPASGYDYLDETRPRPTLRSRDLFDVANFFF